MEKQSIIQPCKERDKDSRPAKDQKVCLYTSDGKRLLGRHPSKEKALKQERTVQKHKHSFRQSMKHFAMIQVEFLRHIND